MVIPSQLCNSVLSPETDRWFRTLVRENRAARQGLDFRRDDFIQMLIDARDENGIISTRLNLF